MPYPGQCVHVWALVDAEKRAYRCANVKLKRGTAAELCTARCVRDEDGAIVDYEITLPRFDDERAAAVR